MVWEAPNENLKVMSKSLIEDSIALLSALKELDADCVELKLAESHWRFQLQGSNSPGSGTRMNASTAVFCYGQFKHDSSSPS